SVRINPQRWLNLQEYQSKELMQSSGVAVQRFFVADTAKNALEAAKRLKAKEIVLKAQILAGGRGKGVFTSGLKGGVHLTKDPAAVGQLAKQMLGFNLTTKQTPKEGVKVNTVMVAEALDISRETYFAILMDRACNGPVMVGSPQGGVDIEEVAASSPEKIFKAADQIKKLYDLFLKVDATQVEVNPLGETPEGQGLAGSEWVTYFSWLPWVKRNILVKVIVMTADTKYARDHEIDFLVQSGLHSVNGAGLAMATCDIIDLHGGKPANFLDLGGGVQESQVYQAFKLLSADPKVFVVIRHVQANSSKITAKAKVFASPCRINFASYS
ncbi:SUCB2 ligase, partial [Polyodon spathula]|nr:SUCB2 ligase [Polyodon spathula]